ncbi:MAG: hypothetical protein ACRDUV_10520 [Pseudonocardiaceae bacterium]
MGPLGRLAAPLGGLLLLVLALALVAGLGTQPPPLATGGQCRLVADDRAATASATEGSAWDAEQLTNARIVVDVADELGLPDRAAVIGLATALQESQLRSLTQAQSDRDSAGIFQQRPSMGWGSLEQVMNPAYAAQTFYDHLVKIPDWTQLPVTVAAQSVQRSAYPDAYAKWKPTAQQLTAALEGTGAATVSCTPDVQPVSSRTPGGGWAPEQMGPDGLTPRTRYLRDLIKSGFGETNLGGWCPGGCTTGHVEGSDHYTGHAIDVMILPYTDPARIADGNRIAAWTVANADQLAIKYVIWRAQIWTPSEGWHTYTHPSGSDDETLLHMDHLHLSVH